MAGSWWPWGGKGKSASAAKAGAKSGPAALAGPKTDLVASGSADLPDFGTNPAGTEDPIAVQKVAEENDTGREDRRVDRILRIVAAVAVVEGGIIIMFAAVLCSMLPLVRYEPFFLTLGTTDKVVYRLDPFLQNAQALNIAVEGYTRNWILKRYSFLPEQKDIDERKIWLKNWTSDRLYKADIEGEAFTTFLNKSLSFGYRREPRIVALSRPQVDWFKATVSFVLYDKEGKVIEAPTLDLDIRFDLQPTQISQEDLMNPTRMDYLNAFNFRVVEHRSRLVKTS